MIKKNWKNWNGTLEMQITMIMDTIMNMGMKPQKTYLTGLPGLESVFSMAKTVRALMTSEMTSNFLLMLIMPQNWKN